MRFFYNIALLIVVVCAAQFAIYTLTHQAIPEIAVLNGILQNPNNIIEFSDSVAHHTSSYDTDQRTIAQMIDAIEPDLDVQLLWHDSYSPVEYDSFLTYIARSGYHPRAIIVPVNLGNVAPINESYPGEQFERLNFVLTTRIPLASIIVQPLAVFGVINLGTISPEDWLAQPTYDWDVPYGTVQDCLQSGKDIGAIHEYVKRSYICGYVTPASLQHPTMRRLVHLMETAARARIPVLVVVTPIDVEEGSKIVGPFFAADIATNASFVCSLATAQGVPCLDLSNTVEDAHFDAHTSATPHLDQYGRSQTAHAIATALKQVLNSSRVH